ncbi:MAG: nitric oxide synthase oxygenase [Saprospiraceae bacterium]|nr:nitric oxide synthase oxygenase [Saprospiraceae bacterium]
MKSTAFIAQSGKVGLKQQAKAFLTQVYTEHDREDELSARLTEVIREIDATGFYTHTFFELEQGARMAWRNSNRCIGRLFWKSLNVIDCRDVTSEDEAFECLLDQLDYATNGGRIRNTISVFAPQHAKEESLRIWNHQTIRYAGFQTANGIIGDPASVELTQKMQLLGWNPQPKPWTILPIVIQKGNQAPKLFEIPKELVLEVPIDHPDYPFFEDLNLRWYAVPMISDMELRIGGIAYHFAPFNGWYMGTEIGARNFADQNRFNLLPVVAEKLGLEKKRGMLWKDQALVVLNEAVLFSYKKNRIRIVDHHTAAEQFQKFIQDESDAGRKATGDWTWLIPPISPASTPIFHQQFDNTVNDPNFYYREQKCPFLS